ncbi:MAG: recombination mediator RecR [Pseudomonadota bacterium]|nr:recombination mediator RecR [Pseudomonadota bacterium]
MLNVPSIDSLVHELSRLPGVGQKSAQRLAYFILRAPKGFSECLRDALKGVEEKVKTCPNCYSFTEEKICHYCSDPKRDDSFLCVVEEPMDILRVESSGAFRGRYHVLQGSISPLDGISPSDLRINELLEKVEQSHQDGNPGVQEVILALDADLEGDTTVLYLSRKLKDKVIKISRIAHGVPIGSDIEYIDHRTLGRALENRIEI